MLHDKIIITWHVHLLRDAVLIYNVCCSSILFRFVFLTDFISFFFLFQMYDAGDFKFLTAVPSPPGQVWMGGDFVAADCVLVWTRVMTFM